MRKLMTVFLVFCMLVLALPLEPTQAQTDSQPVSSGVTVATKIEMLLHEQPAAISETIGKIAGGRHARATERTEDRQWIYICDGWFSRCGWLPTSQVWALGDINRLPVYNTETNVTNQQAIQLYSAGQLYTAPDFGAQSLGTIEASTVLRPQCSTSDMSWYFVELHGQQGWVVIADGSFYRTSPIQIPTCDGTQQASTAYARVDPQAGSIALQAASLCPERFVAIGEYLVLDTKNLPVGFPSMVGLFELLDEQVRPTDYYSGEAIFVEFVVQEEVGGLFEWSGGNSAQWAPTALGGAARMYIDGCDLSPNQGKLVRVVVIGVSRAWSWVHYFAVMLHELAHWLGAEHGPQTDHYNGWDAGNWYRLTDDGTSTPDNYFEVADAAVYGLCSEQKEQKFVERCEQIRATIATQ